MLPYPPNILIETTQDDFYHLGEDGIKDFHLKWIPFNSQYVIERINANDNILQLYFRLQAKDSYDATNLFNMLSPYFPTDIPDEWKLELTAAVVSSGLNRCLSTHIRMSEFYEILYPDFNDEISDVWENLLDGFEITDYSNDDIVPFINNAIELVMEEFKTMISNREYYYCIMPHRDDILRYEAVKMDIM